MRELLGARWPQLEASRTATRVVVWAAVKQAACRAATAGTRTLFGEVCAKASAGFWLVSWIERDTFVAHVAIGHSLGGSCSGAAAASTAPGGSDFRNLAHAALRLA